MNSTEVHFGLGNAAIADSIFIYWASGTIDTCTNIIINQRHEISEGSCGFTSTGDEPNHGIASFELSPNPSRGETRVSWRLKKSSHVRIELSSSDGKKTILLEKEMAPGTYQQFFRIPSGGMYTVTLTSGTQRMTRKLVVQ
jgi:enediyne biosynthesis protein E4